MHRLVIMCMCKLPLLAFAEDMPKEPALKVVAGIAVPHEFARNATLSVGGQDVFEYITSDGQRDLFAVTPAVRKRSIDMLVRGGYRDYCRPQSKAAERILVHRRDDGMTWFVVGSKRTVHIVLANGSHHFEHFLAEINVLCGTTQEKE